MGSSQMRVTALALFLALVPVVAGQSVGFVVKDPEAKLELSSDLSQRVAICVLGQTATAPKWSESRYLVLDPGKPEMIVVDRINGHTVQASERSVGNNRFVFVHYFAGGNQYAVSVYVFTNGRLEKLQEQPPSSNMRSITIEGSALVVKNVENDDRGERRIATDRFELVDALKRGFRGGL